jgi:hypothetical protein
VLVPHGWNTAIGLVTDLHLSAAMPVARYVEYLTPSPYLDEAQAKKRKEDATVEPAAKPTAEPAPEAEQADSGGKNSVAVALGRLGGKKGSLAAPRNSRRSNGRGLNARRRGRGGRRTGAARRLPPREGPSS